VGDIIDVTPLGEIKNTVNDGLDIIEPFVAPISEYVKPTWEKAVQVLDPLKDMVTSVVNDAQEKKFRKIKKASAREMWGHIKFINGGYDNYFVYEPWIQDEDVNGKEQPIHWDVPYADKEGNPLYLTEYEYHKLMRGIKYDEWKHNARNIKDVRALIAQRQKMYVPPETKRNVNDMRNNILNKAKQKVGKGIDREDIIKQISTIIRTNRKGL
jgi:hypothetical protein